MIPFRQMWPSPFLPVQTPPMDRTPLSLGLLAAGLGMLQQAGPSTQKTSLAQALGTGGMQGLQTFVQAKQMQQQQAEAALTKRFREMQMQQLGMELAERQGLPRELATARGILANASGAMHESGTGLPIGTSVTPSSAPVQPVYGQPIPIQSEDIPQDAVSSQADRQLAETGAAKISPIDVLGNKAMALRDEIAELERNVAIAMSEGRLTNPTALIPIDRQIKAKRTELELVEKMHERALSKMHPFTKETGLDPFDPANRTAFENWKKKKTEFAPPQSISVQTYEPAFQKGMAEQQTKTMGAMQNSAVAADTMSAKISLITDLLEGYSGGPISQFQAAFGRVFPESEWGKIASVDDAVNAIRTKLATQVREQGSGQTSNYEMEMYLAAIPSLATTPEGRQMMKVIADRIAKREATASDIYTEMAGKGTVSLTTFRNRIRKEFGDLLSKDEITILRNAAKGVPFTRQGTMRRLD